MDILLTKDADTLICMMYAYYLKRLKNDVPKSKAKYLGEDAKNIQENIIPNWTIDSIAETCMELGRSELISCLNASDSVYDLSLTTKGIIYMENRFKNKLNSVLEYIERITKPLL